MRFARDRWYSGEGQRRLQQRARSESMGTRRIISLTLLLLMILVVMQQLGDPEKYGPAFQAIGLTQPKGPIASETVQATRQASIAKEDSSGAAWGDEASRLRRSLAIAPESLSVDLFMQMWLRLFESASPDVLNELAIAELSSNTRNNAKADDQPSLPNKSSAAVLDWFASTQSRVERWQQDYHSLLNTNSNEPQTENKDLELGMTFVTQWLVWASLHRNGVSLASSSLDPDLQAGLQLALDRRLLGMVHDNTPWRSQERPTLARTLQRAKAIADAFDGSEALRRDALQASPIVEVTSLMKQTNEYRGQVVRIVGNSVTNPDPSMQRIEGWGQFQYDVIWIRPVDGSQQPICVYSLRKPDNGWPTIPSSHSSKSSSLNSPVDMDTADTPLVEIGGIILKRLVYPSQRGVDVAPVLIACDVRWLADASLDPMVSSKVRFPNLRSRRWIEPGEQAANLQVLEDIFLKDLESLSEPNVQSRLNETSQAENLDREVPQLGRILYQMPRVSKPLAAAITTGKKIGPAQLACFRGWVRSVDTIRLRDMIAATEDSGTIYRLQIEPTIESHDDASIEKATHVAYVNQIPKQWKSLSTLSQPISLSGIYLESTTENRLKRCWIADHADWSWPWLVDSSTFKESFSPKLPDDWQRLGAVGFDLGQVDMLQNLRGKPISSQESPAFYSLIDCGDRISKTSEPFADTAYSAIDCLQEKNPPHLRRVRAKVHIVRATRILVTDERDQSSLDGEAYYELDGLANLGDLSIQLKSPDGRENVFFEGEFPITLISKQIPAWLAVSMDTSMNRSVQMEAVQDDEPVDMPATWYPRTTVEVEGIFYRLWSFSTAQTSALGSVGNKRGNEEARIKQIGPLVAVTKWEKSVDQARSTPNRSIVREIATAIGLSIIGIYGLYRLNQSSKRRKA